MAKGKHSPALFEVVHGKKHFDKSATVLRTPNWWFKGRHRGPVAPVMDAGDPPAFADEEVAADPTLRGLPSPTADRQPEPEPVPAEYESSLDDPTAFAVPHPRRRNAAFQFVIDRDRQEFYLRVRYTAAVIAGFALVVVIALAYLGGRHFGRGPAAVLASQSSEEVAAGPVAAGVLDVGTHSGARKLVPGPGIGAGGVSAQPAPVRTEASLIPPPNTASPRPQGPSTPVKPPAEVDNGPRVIGNQYLVIQSYAGDQRKLAEEARDFLMKNGVPCTIENGVAGWPPNWHTVVGMQGFERASGPQFDAYRDRIVRIGDDFAGKSAWKRFDPRAIRWKGN